LRFKSEKTAPQTLTDCAAQVFSPIKPDDDLLDLEQIPVSWNILLVVIPAKAGIQGPSARRLPWIPAFAGMTMMGKCRFDLLGICSSQWQ
jgi:hypothetical protein